MSLSFPFWITTLALAVGMGGKPSPIPKDAKPPVSCVVTRDAKLAPLEDGAFTLTITNNTSEAIGLYSTLPGGLYVFLDVEIQNPAGKRISPERYDAVIASPFSPDPRLVGKLEPNKPVKLDLWLTRYLLEAGELKPGKYRVRVKFSYSDRDATSGWVEWEIPVEKK